MIPRRKGKKPPPIVRAIPKKHTHDDETVTVTGYAPDTADYLVGTTQAGLSAEIVVGTTPGGELGGTWASPTVDATHAGSTHVSTTATNTWTQKQTFSGEIEIDGALNHDGTTVGFYGVTPTTRPSAYTQTYSTTSRAVNTDTSTGSIPTNVTPYGYGSSAAAQAVSTNAQRALNNSTLALELINAILDDLQANGLAQ